MYKRLFVLILLVSALVATQTDQKKDIWQPLAFLEGKWQGGQSGVSKVTQEYQFIFNRKFLQVKTRAVFEPTEKNPKGEVHEDLGIFSYDQSRKTFVFRQFHIEGFVNQYILEKKDDKTDELIFVSEHIENAPSGTKAKEVFKIISEDEIDQSFHVAWPGKDFACYSVNRLKRKK